MNLEYKTIPFTEFKTSDTGNGIVSGYASVFGNVDLQNDRVLPGAFKAGLEQFFRDGFISWGHDWDTPVATISEASEDDHGLRVSAEFHSTPIAQEKRVITSERIARGKSMGLSIGYSVNQNGAARGADGVRDLKSLTVFEAALTPVPANTSALVTAAKHAKAGNPDNLVCPYCSPKADPGSKDTADCSCDADCGEGDCPTGSKSAKDMTMVGNANPFAYPLLASYEDLQNDLTEAAQSMLPAWAMTDLAGLLGDADDLQYACAVLVATLPAEAIFFLCPDPWNDPDDGVYVRVPYTMDASSGEPQIGTPTPVQPAFVPVNTAQIIEGASRIARGAQGVAQKARETARRTKEGRMLSGANRSALQEALAALTQATASVQALLDASAPADTGSDDDMKAWAESSRILARTLGAPV